MLAKRILCPPKNPKTSLPHIEIDNKTFSCGEFVKVSGLRGEFKIKEIRNESCIILWGGTSGKEKYRTFDGCSLRKIRQKRKSYPAQD